MLRSIMLDPSGRRFVALLLACALPFLNARLSLGVSDEILRDLIILTGGYIGAANVKAAIVERARASQAGPPAGEG